MTDLDLFNRLLARGEEGRTILYLMLLVALECDRERYGWAKFWRDEIRWLTRPAFEAIETERR